MALENIMEVFRKNRPNLLADPVNEGRYALVNEEKVIGVYPSFDAALAVGYELLGLRPFLIQQVVQHEIPKYFSRNIKCP
jgi:hypothetical protein